MQKNILIGFWALLIHLGCDVIEIQSSVKKCTADLSRLSGRPNVSLDRPEAGQFSIYCKMDFYANYLAYGGDTLLTAIENVNSDSLSFGYKEQVCYENYLNPNFQTFPSEYLLSRIGDRLRGGKATRLLEFDNINDLELHPQGDIVILDGLLPPKNMHGPVYGRILDFTIGNRTIDTVSVFVDSLHYDQLNYWVYTAKEEVLRFVRIDSKGNGSGWERIKI